MTTDLEMDVRPRPMAASKAASADQPTWLERLGRRALLARLQKLSHGEITLVEADAMHTFGRQTETCSLHASLVVHRPQFFRRAAFGGDVGAAEAFMDGDWSCDNLANLVRIRITDTGTGIAPEDLPHLFDRFYRGDDSRSGSNTGLGLAIAKAWVEAMGGNIGVESNTGEGSSFWFTLQAVKA